MLNVVAFNGRLTADPELRHTNNDIAVANFTLAIDRSYVKAGASRTADFVDIVCWRNTAEFAAKYFKKGQLVAVNGSIQSKSYTDSSGIRRKAVYAVAANVHFAEPRRDNYSSEQQQDGTGKQTPQYVSSGNDNDFVEIDGTDDLPF